MVSPRIRVPLPRTSSRLLSRRGISSSERHDTRTILRIPKANVYRFGQANAVSEPVFKDLEWTVKEDESWAIVAPAGTEKSDLLQILMGYMRISPPPQGGLYPFLSSRDPPVDPYNAVSMVSFTSRPPAPTPGSGMSAGAFFDYTVRYGAIREELRSTLRETLFSQIDQNGRKNNDTLIEEVLERLDLKHLMDLPFVVLSNGQTRRARVAKALLGKPELLLLDEPLTGLDASHRPQLTALLHDLHVSRNPRILMALRLQDPLPEWITHVAVVEGQHVKTRKRNELGNGGVVLLNHHPNKPTSSIAKPENASVSVGRQLEKQLVVMQNVNVRYHDRHVLKKINWSIREGDKWHLQGPNGSGKTTLLSLLLGTHPQSYSLPSSSLSLFSLPRRKIPTMTLQKLIGHISPEIFSAFPRKGGESGMSVREAIGTGFEGVFSYRPLSDPQRRRVDFLLDALGPTAWHQDTSAEDTRAFSETKFATLPPAHQSLVLLLRAFVSRPPLLILDEPFAGMDSRMIDAVKRYLRDELDSEVPGNPSSEASSLSEEPEAEKSADASAEMAIENPRPKRKTSVVFVSHWEDELPWDASEVKRIRLMDGEAVFVV